MNKLSSKIMFGLVSMTVFAFKAQAYCVSESSKVSNALHLSIDVSGSIDSKEMILQMEGLEGALRDVEVQDALMTCGCTEVSVSFWASAARLVLPPVKVMTVSDIDRIVSFFANESRRPLLQRYYYELSEMTHVDQALELSLSQVISSHASRKVILISGDGQHSRIDQGSMNRLDELKSRAEENDVEVSAASINVYTGIDLDRALVSKPVYGFEVERSGLLFFRNATDFYSQKVITEHGSVREARTFNDYRAVVTESIKKIACTPMM